MIIKDIIDNKIYVEYNGNNYMIKRDYIGGTSIINYWLYGCYGTDDYEYFIDDYTSCENALKDLLDRGVE